MANTANTNNKAPAIEDPIIGAIGIVDDLVD